MCHPRPALRPVTPSRSALRAAALYGAIACGALAAAAPAHAMTLQDDAPPGAATPRNAWTLGRLPLAVTAPDRTDRIGELHDKYRIGGAMLPWLAPYATLKPWLTAQPGHDGEMASTGGLLLDVPLGSFTFTPSIGAGYMPVSPAEPAGDLQVRSQLELGYDFANDARVALGYSHIVPAGEGADTRASDNVFSFTFRLPFGAVTGW